MCRAIGHWRNGLLTWAGIWLALSGAQAAAAYAACPASIPLDLPIARASTRFAISEPLIRSVIAIESNFAVFAVSPKGAMGLMQLMPDTWRELRLRYALGPDPFDPCDNILAGTAYLRELLDRYGDPGFLAAYNAGPGRYEAHLRGRPLPRETIAYVARVSGRMVPGNAPAQARALPDPDAWRRGGLFARAPKPMPEQINGERNSASLGLDEETPTQPPKPTQDSLFVPRTGAPK